MKKLLTICLLLIISAVVMAQPPRAYNFSFDSLAKRWDEAIPLGNGWLGVLIWQKGDKLRLSLDRVDLWDDRPMPEIDRLKFSFVVQQVKKGEYDTVQKLGDVPYEKYPAPTKIPGAAIEFDLSKLGRVVSNELDLSNGLSVIKFDNGIVFNNYIHANEQTGYFGFENLSIPDVIPELIIPAYNKGTDGKSSNSVEGYELARLGYKPGTIKKETNSILYHQPTWNNQYYEVLVKWYPLPGNRLIGQWTITNNKRAKLRDPNFRLKEPTGWPSHIAWWNDYWSRSSISIPDTLLEKQYYREMYKFACVARPNTPPISLQAIWTADDGRLPPWKGDFHHDLNTQLSYWPGYTGNHLDLTASYTNWLWKVREVNKKWTTEYFEMDGLNVPGVTTISGKPMGGWIQYSMSPTTSAWLAQHFYWQALYSMDKATAKKAERYLWEVYLFLNSYLGKSRRDTAFIPLSSSPEYHDNSIKAWFKQTTNYDRAQMLSIKPYYSDVKEIVEGRRLPLFDTPDNLDEIKDFDVNETGLTVAPGQNLESSHRHLSPYMAIYPLCLLDIGNENDKTVIENSIRQIERKGTRQWTGYSFSWMASIYARTRKADSAAKMLRIFASNFCSPNSFHLNGDQRGGEYSDFTYRPFTLEGNFAFAQAIHEMLLQYRNGVVEIFPAVPKAWKDISFKTLRVPGAFLVSADMEGTVPSAVVIKADHPGVLRLKNPFKTFYFPERGNKYVLKDGIFELEMKKGETITIKNAFE